MTAFDPLNQTKMRKVNRIVLHCTATPQTTTVASIQRHWREVNKWVSPGYHYLIKPDGEAVNLLPIDKVSNGVAGHNANSIHISYIGGIDKNGKALDNRTEAQKATQIRLIKEMLVLYPDAEVCGHRDFLVPGTAKWKDCPSFDAKGWWAGVMAAA
jgi:N-acetylmuramoyl-L-alanine amidase